MHREPHSSLHTSVTLRPPMSASCASPYASSTAMRQRILHHPQCLQAAQSLNDELRCSFMSVWGRGAQFSQFPTILTCFSSLIHTFTAPKQDSTPRMSFSFLSRSFPHSPAVSLFCFLPEVCTDFTLNSPEQNNHKQPVLFKKI